MVTIFRQRRNDANDIKAIADDYETKIGHSLWLVDGLQKDAIQNSWDARIDKKYGKDWECGFSLLDINGESILCIEDSGTTGLNGTKFYNEDELSGILNSDKSREDLAYFLNSNWSKKSSDEGGNRGRGKTLFLIASRKKEIFFDSVRSTDGDYICGKIYLDNDKQIKFELYYSKDALRFFSDITKNKILPLKHCGTRIFIVDSDPIINSAIKSGEILSFISNCRWETIKKYHAKIFISHENNKRYAELPKWYEDATEFQSKEIVLQKIKEDSNLRMKRLVLRYAPDSDIPETMRGISIQRGGMSIQIIKAADLVHEEGMNDIYGWVEMDELLEKGMKEIEGPEHFDFVSAKNPVKSLKICMAMKIREFARELKIITPEEARKNKIQQIAGENASKMLGSFFKKIGLTGKHKGRQHKKPHERKEDELLRLSISDIKFPRDDDRRVNYGEEINNSYVVPINESSENILALVRFFIVSDEGKIKIIEEKEIDVQIGKGIKIGVDKIIIDSTFKKGGHTLRARMISLEKKNWNLSDGTPIEKGTILYDRINQKFYVEVDPPEHGPFRFQPEKKETKDHLFRWEPEGEDGYVVFYNELHPRIGAISDDAEKLGDYLIEQGVLIAIQIKLEELMAEETEQMDLELKNLIKSKDISKVWPMFLGKYSEFIWDIKEKQKNGNKNNK